MATKRKSKVWLEPEEHVYIHEDTEVKYKSVTTVLSMLEEHFDTEGVARAISLQLDEDKKPEYIGMSKQEIFDEWERINREANEYGTEVHEILERYLLADRIYVPKSDYEKEIITKFQKIDPMTTGVVYPETILFSEKHSLAGTADIIEDCGDYFNVWDFKTNKKLNYISQYGQWLKKPVSHLSDCQFNIYALQMSIYAYMFQMETRKKVGRMALFYLNPEKDYEFEIIPVNYMGYEAKKVLDFLVRKTKRKEWIENLMIMNLNFTGVYNHSFIDVGVCLVVVKY